MNALSDASLLPHRLAVDPGRCCCCIFSHPSVNFKKCVFVVVNKRRDWRVSQLSQRHKHPHVAVWCPLVATAERSSCCQSKQTSLTHKKTLIYTGHTGSHTKKHSKVTTCEQLLWNKPSHEPSHYCRWLRSLAVTRRGNEDTAASISRSTPMKYVFVLIWSLISSNLFHGPFPYANTWEKTREREWQSVVEACLKNIPLRMAQCV